jgi:hypothetical protein
MLTNLRIEKSRFRITENEKTFNALFSVFLIQYGGCHHVVPI